MFKIATDLQIFKSVNLWHFINRTLLLQLLIRLIPFKIIVEQKNYLPKINKRFSLILYPVKN